MYRLFMFSVISLSISITSGCNTIGGLGQDMSEAGRAIGNAAHWSQDQIEAIDQEVSSPHNAQTPSQIIVEEPDTINHY